MFTITWKNESNCHPLTLAVDEAGNFGYRPLLEAMYVARLEDDVAARLATAPERMLIPLGRILNVIEGN